MDKFLEADFSAIRNKTAFFIGILKRFRAVTPSLHKTLDESLVSFHARVLTMLLPVCRRNPARLLHQPLGDSLHLLLCFLLHLLRSYRLDGKQRPSLPLRTKSVRPP